MVISKSHRHWMLASLLVAQIGAAMSCSSAKTSYDALPAADGGGDDIAIDGSGGPSMCAFAAGRTFGSVTPMECGIGLNGQLNSCTWTIAFTTNGTYQWSHSDVGQIGTYHCEGHMFFMQPDNGTAISVPFDRTTGHLTWQGVDYVIQP